MTEMNAAFCPSAGGSVNQAVAPGSQRLLVCRNSGPINIRIFNNGTATAWYRFGDNTVVADMVAGVPIGAGGCEVITVFPAGGEVWAAVVAEGATGPVFFTPGVGI